MNKTEEKWNPIKAKEEANNPWEDSTRDLYYRDLNAGFPKQGPVTQVFEGNGWQDAQGFPSKEPDMVNHPPHYTTGKIEVLDFIEDQKLPYLLGNVVKYICRAEHKGTKKQDLEKALFYLKRAIG